MTKGSAGKTDDIEAERLKSLFNGRPRSIIYRKAQTRNKCTCWHSTSIQYAQEHTLVYNLVACYQTENTVYNMVTVILSVSVFQRVMRKYKWVGGGYCWNTLRAFGTTHSFLHSQLSFLFFNSYTIKLLL